MSFFFFLLIIFTFSVPLFSNETPQLYTVLTEKRADRIGQAMMGSTHVYEMGGGAAASGAQKSK